MPTRNAHISLYTSAGTKTLTGTTAETSLIPPGGPNSSNVLPAYTAAAGAQLRIKGKTAFTIGALPLTPSLIVRVKLNSIVVASVTTSSLVNSLTSAGGDFEFILSCVAAGLNGAVIGGGEIEYGTGLGIRKFDDLNVLTQVALDFTQDQVVDVTGQFDSATGRSLTVLSSSMEIL